MTANLPSGFAALEPFVSKWAVAGARQRSERRGESTTVERRSFYDAAAAALPQALAYLDTKPVKNLDAADTRLMNLMLSLAHVALAVENQGEAEADHAHARARIPITRAPSDA